jgi:hypothetical protein
MERPESNFKIIGGGDAEIAEAESAVRDNRKWQELKVAKFEIAETEKDKAIIREVQTAVDRVVRECGGNPVPISQNQIHVVRPGSLTTLGEGRFKHGFAATLEQYVVVERGPSDTDFAGALAHELLHWQSPTVAKIVDDPNEPKLYRRGMVMVDLKNPDVKIGHEKQYFAELEEAIVAEATDRVLGELVRSNEFVRAETTLFARIKPWLHTMLVKANRTTEEENRKMLDGLRAAPAKEVEEILAVLDGNKLSEDQKLVFLYGEFRKLHAKAAISETERTHEREKFDKLVDGLVAGYQGRMTREEVKQEFLKANFAGNYLRIARLIEHALGKGTFRKVAEDFSQRERPTR